MGDHVLIEWNEVWWLPKEGGGVYHGKDIFFDICSYVDGLLPPLDTLGGPVWM